MIFYEHYLYFYRQTFPFNQPCFKKRFKAILKYLSLFLKLQYKHKRPDSEIYCLENILFYNKLPNKLISKLKRVVRKSFNKTIYNNFVIKIKYKLANRHAFKCYTYNLALNKAGLSHVVPDDKRTKLQRIYS